MIELTDADREAIREVVKRGHENFLEGAETDEAIYLAGKLAERERCAQICESSVYRQSRGAACADRILQIAAAIRALAKGE